MRVACRRAQCPPQPATAAARRDAANKPIRNKSIYIYINDALPENASTRFTVLNHRTVRSDAATSIIVRRAKTVITESERVAAVISQTPLLASNTRYRGNIQFNYLDSKKIVVNNS